MKEHCECGTKFVNSYDSFDGGAYGDETISCRIKRCHTCKLQYESRFNNHDGYSGGSSHSEWSPWRREAWTGGKE